MPKLPRGALKRLPPTTQKTPALWRTIPTRSGLPDLIAGWENNAGLSLNFKVCKAPEVNALPAGLVRVYSGPMDLMEDDERRFVLCRESGHVKHGRSKARFRTAWLTQAACERVVATDSVAGRLGSSELGGLVESVVKASIGEVTNSNPMATDLGCRCGRI